MDRTRRRATTHPLSQQHELLGVPADASPAAIKRAYRQLAATLHPDTNPGDPAAAEDFRDLTVAYHTLLEAACDRGGKGDGADDEGHDTAPDQPPGGDGSAAASEEPVEVTDHLPVELPATISRLLVRLLLAIPGVWATQGFPGVTGQMPTLSGTRALAGLIVLLVGWWLAGIVLWSRSPAVPEKLAAWRSPGWDGTALVLRLLVFYLLTFGSTIVLLSGSAEDDGLAWWRPALWCVVVAAGWVISGQVPSRLGYRSRSDRYWRTGSLPAESAGRPETRTGAHSPRQSK